MYMHSHNMFSLNWDSLHLRLSQQGMELEEKEVKKIKAYRISV